MSAPRLLAEWQTSTGAIQLIAFLDGNLTPLVGFHDTASEESFAMGCEQAVELMEVIATWLESASSIQKPTELAIWETGGGEIQLIAFDHEGTPMMGLRSTEGETDFAMGCEQALELNQVLHAWHEQRHEIARVSEELA